MVVGGSNINIFFLFDISNNSSIYRAMEADYFYFRCFIIIFLLFSVYHFNKALERTHIEILLKSTKPMHAVLFSDLFVSIWRSCLCVCVRTRASHRYHCASFNGVNGVASIRYTQKGINVVRCAYAPYIYTAGPVR